MRRAPVALVALAFAVAGCGENVETTSYAGISEGEVVQEALNVVGRELRAPGSPLYRHRVRVERVPVRKGRNSRGDRAWVARVFDKTAGASFCVRLWATTALNVRVYNSEIGPCDLPSDPPAERDDGRGPA